MKAKNFKDFIDTDKQWMKKQISFISRMSGMKGDLIIIKDGKKYPTRKLTSLLIWGHCPKNINLSELELL